MSVKECVKIVENAHCSDCGSAVIEVMPGQFPQGACADYWQYCANMVCKNHTGEGIDGGYAEFVELEG